MSGPMDGGISGILKDINWAAEQSYQFGKSFKDKSELASVILLTPICTPIMAAVDVLACVTFLVLALQEEDKEERSESLKAAGKCGLRCGRDAFFAVANPVALPLNIGTRLCRTAIAHMNRG